MYIGACRLSFFPLVSRLRLKILPHRERSRTLVTSSHPRQHARTLAAPPGPMQTRRYSLGNVLLVYRCQRRAEPSGMERIYDLMNNARDTLQRWLTKFQRKESRNFCLEIFSMKKENTESRNTGMKKKRGCARRRWRSFRTRMEGNKKKKKTRRGSFPSKAER